MFPASSPFLRPVRSRLAIRLITSDGRATVLRRTLLPVIGEDDVILPAFDDTLGTFAMRAQEGDTDARDALFFAYLPKLERLMSYARPPHALSGMTGIWDRDDVEQEAYLVFVELVEGWSGDVPFTAWLLSRFPWRLKDAIRDGIGKPSGPPRQRVVPIEDAAFVPVEVAGLSPEDREVIDAVLDRLPEYLGQILIEHALHGKSKAAIAREIGISRRTMVRYWQEIRRRAMETLGEMSS
jgi:RNA polymerase sigma factor (sigma-70 family)